MRDVECVELAYVGVSHGPEMCGSEPSMLPYLTRGYSF